ncbi:hypothetical protein DTX73_09965 [Enterococcus faecium]|uniref:Uncharacterized protein n=1 Tax=Enterococcus faecium TaxID=1352 RepID=A0A7V7GM33_ENTFC|nr:hypothetical protein DTX73_09965 [Enterococcus faecium]
MYENCFSNFCEISAYFRRSYFWNTVYSEKGTATRLLSQFLIFLIRISELDESFFELMNFS